MANKVRRTLAGGLVAIGIAAGASLLGAGTAFAHGPQPPANPGSYVGQNAYVQEGSNPTITRFTWNGSSWGAGACIPDPAATSASAEK